MEQPGRTVLGREGELARIDAWLAAIPRVPPPSPPAAPPSPPAAPSSPPAPPTLLVIAGEPGIGKTTLWAEATRRANAVGYQLLTSRPVPSDAGLPHVVLADLLHPVADDALASLPGPQRRALEVALLRAEPGDGELDPRAVGTGLTVLLGRMAADGPLVLAIDDAQWLDPASARVLAFALRRLESWQGLQGREGRDEGEGAPIGLLAAVRITEQGRPGEFAAVLS